MAKSESKSNYELMIFGVVAMVAIVGMVVLLKGSASGGVVVMEGSFADSFGRPYGGMANSVYGERLPCYYDAEGSMVCPGAHMGGQFPSRVQENRVLEVQEPVQGTH